MAQALRRSDPAGAILYIGRRGGPEAAIAGAYQLDARLIPAAGLNRDHPWRNWRLPYVLPAGFWQALRAVRAFRPDVLLSTGGYVTPPVVAASRVRGVPVVLQEQNVRPGWATRVAVPAAWAVALGFAEASTRITAAHVVVTGNPVRAGFGAEAPAPRALRRLLFMGGSQGARHLNDVLAATLPSLLQRPEIEIVHLAGERDFPAVQARRQGLDPNLAPRYRLQASTDDMPALMRSSDLVVGRAGAMTIAEATALGRPLLLVPGRFGGGHQAANAEAVRQAGAALVIRDAELNPDRLVREVVGLLQDPAHFERLCRASRAFGRPHAADAVVELLRQAVAA